MKPYKMLNGRVKCGTLRQKTYYGFFFGRGNTFNKEEMQRNDLINQIIVPPEMNGEYWDRIENARCTPKGNLDEFGGL